MFSTCSFGTGDALKKGGAKMDLKSRLKWVDIPPVWLVGFLVLPWAQARLFPELTWHHWFISLSAGLLVGAGFVLMGMALIAFRRAQTTPVPHRVPTQLITTGIFGRSRNPIYLGDVLILTGLTLHSGAWICLIFVPVFIWILTDRFIRPEEERLKRTFGNSFVQWSTLTHRWF
ncbi:MAG: protein-S-isoprenylcysteine O-methyltransferase Ste14 [Paracoccaceae bacterium]